MSIAYCIGMPFTEYSNRNYSTCIIYIPLINRHGLLKKMVVRFAYEISLRDDDTANKKNVPFFRRFILHSTKITRNAICRSDTKTNKRTKKKKKNTKREKQIYTNL